MSTTDTLTIETPTGTVHATAGPRRTDSVVFELHGAMRGSVHVTGTQHPRYWDQFTAVRACLGPVDTYETTAPDDALPRLARGGTGYHGSLTRYPADYGDRPEVSVWPPTTAAGNEPSAKTTATLTAVLRACADSVAQRDDLPLILDASRLRKTPGLLRFLNWASAHADAAAVRYEAESQSARPAPDLRRITAAALPPRPCTSPGSDPPDRSRGRRVSRGCRPEPRSHRPRRRSSRLPGTSRRSRGPVRG